MNILVLYAILQQKVTTKGDEMIRSLCKTCNVRDKSSSFELGLKTAIESAPTCLESVISFPFRNRCTDFIGIILGMFLK